MTLESLSLFMAVAGICIGAVNVITEVLKNTFIKKETSKPLVVFIVSEIVCLAAIYMYTASVAVKFTPVVFIGSLIGGFFLSYGAMYGYDKLYGDFFKSIESIFTEKE